MKIFMKISFVFAINSMFLSEAQADVWCSGVATRAWVDNGGWVSANWGYGDFTICNINVDAELPSPQQTVGYKTCQAWYSTILTAKATASTIMAYLPTQATCAGFAPDPVHSNVGNYFISVIRIDK